MEFAQSLRAIRRNAVVIVVTILAALAAGVAFILFAPPSYTTEAKVLLEPTRGTGTAQELVQGNNLVVQQVATYAQLVATPLVLQPVIDELGLDATPEELAEDVTAAPVETSAIIGIEVTADTAQGAADLGQSVANSLIAAVEGPEGQTPVAITARVVQAPVAPEAPSSPDPLLAMLVALAAGLAVAFLIVVLREISNGRVRNAADVARATDAPFLGRTLHARGVRRAPLVMQSAPTGRAAESFRMLRGRLAAAAGAADTPVIVVSAATGASGTSIVAANLAVAIAEGGVRVALIDANLRRPALARFFGIDAEVGLDGVLRGEAEPSSLSIGSVSPELRVVVARASTAGASELLGSARAADIFARIGRAADVVVVDAGPLVAGADGVALADVATGYVVLARSGRSRIADLRDATGILDAVGSPIYGVLLADAPRRGADARD